MPQEPTYKIILLGASAGVVDVQAQAGFAKLFNLSVDKVEKIFAQGQRTLKTGLSAEQAQKYIDRLAEVGVACEMAQEVAESTATVDEPAPASPPEQGAHEPVAAGTPPPTGVGKSTDSYAADDKREVPFVFTGNGFEYFKIWIVNILLSIVTLGIYSAWAKVRNKQYFYGNTHLDEASFEYTADPVKILIGRVIALVFLVLYTLSGKISLIIGTVMGIALIVALPWIICQSMRFNARYSSYRNVRFAFNGRLGEAALVLLLWPLLGAITLGILMPYAIFQQKKFIYANHGYGTQSFVFSATVSQYYVAFLLTLAIYVGAIACTFIPYVGPLLALVGYLYGFAYFTTALANINYNAITLKSHALKANWNAKDYLILMAVNTLLIVLTLGLFIPWAKVRTAHFKARYTQAVLAGNFDTLVEQEKESVNALAESVGDLFDIDIGF
ncbi:YjgN family protein [Gilvimarinus sp. 1_MG-2023]|uniref:YjgN family protein n=1 Tax=Gilvimarinus sp. 1_MG-2023 TaxID=3062638 RepID=UPI0026E3BD13|nr:YjgN family protein [Gilvimarinus sp. 1_MG-2023]MDO6746965.1 YjgN family protein [Gilvimarinus sp. 1_MG-2023]